MRELQIRAGRHRWTRWPVHLPNGRNADAVQMPPMRVAVDPYLHGWRGIQVGGIWRKASRRHRTRVARLAVL